MSALTVRLSKEPDGSVVLSCTRADGTATWQRHRRHAAFFPLHDLAHLAVETTLGLADGFFGLLASGWNITDFGGRPVPAEAALAEAVVGLIDGERATGRPYSAAEINRALAASLGHGGHALDRPLTDEDLAAIRLACQNLTSQWARVPTGEALALPFERPAVRPAAP